jgi:hypothetical protein
MLLRLASALLAVALMSTVVARGSVSRTAHAQVLYPPYYWKIDWQADSSRQTEFETFHAAASGRVWLGGPAPSDCLHPDTLGSCWDLIDATNNGGVAGDTYTHLSETRKWPDRRWEECNPGTSNNCVERVEPQETTCTDADCIFHFGITAFRPIDLANVKPQVLVSNDEIVLNVVLLEKFYFPGAVSADNVRLPAIDGASTTVTVNTLGFYPDANAPITTTWTFTAHTRQLTAVPGGPYDVQRAQPVQLDGSQSQPGDSAIVAYDWSWHPKPWASDCENNGDFRQLASPGKSGEVISIVPLCDLELVLTVTDEAGNIASQTSSLNVTARPEFKTEARYAEAIGFPDDLKNLEQPPTVDNLKTSAVGLNMANCRYQQSTIDPSSARPRLIVSPVATLTVPPGMR